MTRSISALMILALALGGCVAPDGRVYQPGPKATIGALGGAAAGGLLGSRAGRGRGEAIAAGVILGALIGGVIGDQLDAQDRRYAREAAYRSFEYSPTGHRREWRNPDTGNSGWVSPTYTYQRPSGQYCREYRQTIVIGGRRERAYGTACREPDGSWRIVN